MATAPDGPAPAVPPELRPDIAAAALSVFQDKGYRAATVREIADRAGLGVSSLYFHIGSKEELLLALVRPVLEVGADWMEEICAASLPPAEKLRAACVQAAELYDHHPEIGVYLRDFYPVVERTFPELATRARAGWIEIVGSVMADRGEPDPVQVRLTTYGILGMFSWMQRWYDPEGERTSTEIGHLFADLVLRGLEPRAGDNSNNRLVD